MTIDENGISVHSSVPGISANWEAEASAGQAIRIDTAILMAPWANVYLHAARHDGIRIPTMAFPIWKRSSVEAALKLAGFAVERRRFWFPWASRA